MVSRSIGAMMAENAMLTATAEPVVSSTVQYSAVSNA